MKTISVYTPGSYQPRRKKILIEIGMVRYGAYYHPTNEVSKIRFKAVLTLCGVQQDLDWIGRGDREQFTEMAKRHGFLVRYFNKGLGR